jgi:hypothetical protein
MPKIARFISSLRLSALGGTAKGFSRKTFYMQNEPLLIATKGLTSFLVGQVLVAPDTIGSQVPQAPDIRFTLPISYPLRKLYDL